MVHLKPLKNKDVPPTYGLKFGVSYEIPWLLSISWQMQPEDTPCCPGCGAAELSLPGQCVGGSRHGTAARSFLRTFMQNEQLKSYGH